VSNQKPLYNQKEIDELPEDYQLVYYEQLARQSELAKFWAELEKRGGKVRQGTTYPVLENGNKSSLEPSSTS
jgi:hypothetical protein